MSYVYNFELTKISKNTKLLLEKRFQSASVLAAKVIKFFKNMIKIIYIIDITMLFVDMFINSKYNYLQKRIQSKLNSLIIICNAFSSRFDKNHAD